MAEKIYQFNGQQLLTATRELVRAELRVALPPRVFTCLRYLIEHRDRAVGREELIAAVWKRSNVSDIQLGQLVLRSRRVLGDEGNAQYSIRTVVGFGYHWIAPVEVEDYPVEPASAADLVAMQVQLQPQEAAVAGSPREAVAAAGMPARRPAWHGWLLAASATLLLVLLLWSQQPVPGRSKAGADLQPRVAVLPFQVPGEADVAWARLGGMDLVADRLRRSGLVTTPSEMTLRLAPDPLAGASAPALAALRREGGVTLVVNGQVRYEDNLWLVELHADDSSGHSVRVHGQDHELLAALRLGSDHLLAALGRRPVEDAPELGTDLIQRVRAALLTDDPQHARELIDVASERERREPLIRYFRAQALARSGEFEQAEQAFSTLLEQTSAVDNARLYMRILVKRGHVREASGRWAEARADFAAAINAPGAQQRPAELGEALNGRAMMSAHQRDFAAATYDLGNARVQIERVGDVLGVARLDSNMGLIMIERGALSSAFSNLTRAAQRFEAFGAPRELINALDGIRNVQLLELNNSAALATSEQLWALAESAGDPRYRRALVPGRAETLLVAGRLREARRLLDALPLVAATDTPQRDLEYERTQMLRVRLALQDGRPELAAELAAALPTAVLPMGDDQLRATAALLRQRALGTASTLDSAPPPAPAAETGQPSPTAAPLRLLAQAERAATLDAAGPLYTQALAAAENSGIALVIATVVISHAQRLMAAGRMNETAALVGRVSVWAQEDFDCALLALQLAQASADRYSWRQALERARAIAGERVIPAALLVAPLR